MIMKYIYQAVFCLVENGYYTVSVPDLPGCHTQGKDLQDAIFLWVFDADANMEPIPAASEINRVTHKDPEFIRLIVVDTSEYRAANGFTAVNRI